MADKDKNKRFVAKSDATYVRPVIPDTRSNNYDPRKRRFYEKHESHEIFYDPYQGRVVRRGIPLEISSPEFDILGIGRAMSMIRKPTIALAKRKDYGSRLSPRNYGYKKALEKGARHEAKTYAVESGIDNSNIDNILLGKNFTIAKDKDDVVKPLIISRQDLKDEAERFNSYIRSKEVQDRLKSIDDELGTNYLDEANELSNPLFSGSVLQIKSGPYFNPDINGRTMIPSLARGELPTTARDIRISMHGNPVVSTYGHEVKHGIDALSSAKSGIRGFENARTKLLTGYYDKNGKFISNLKSKDEFADKLTSRYNMSRKEAEDEYDDIINGTEISSLLHNMVIKNRFLGNPQLPKYDENLFEKTMMDFSLGADDNRLYDIWNHLVKDKKKFIDSINKYSFSLYPAVLWKKEE